MPFLFGYFLMENYTFNSFTLQLEGLKVSEVSKYPIFFFFLFLFSYILIMTSNIGIVLLVFIDQNLHHHEPPFAFRYSAASI